MATHSAHRLANGHTLTVTENGPRDFRVIHRDSSGRQVSTRKFTSLRDAEQWAGRQAHDVATRRKALIQKRYR